MKNIDYTEINLEKLFKEAEEKEQQQHKKEGAAKKGNLRGGNAGCITERGEVVGGCHRVHLARVLGIDTPVSDNSRMHFHQGLAIEETMANLLRLSHPGKVLQEEEVAVKWNTKSGRNVTGRPDIVLADESGKLIVGIEAKTVCSSKKAEDVYWDHKPSIEHLIQAGHYSMNLGIPFVLLYWHSNSLDAGYFIRKRKENMLPNGKLNWKLKTPPFRMYFSISFNNGRLEYKDMATGKVTKTPITAEGITNYYELVDEMLAKKELGPRKRGMTANGEELPFDVCNYCTFSKACKKYEELDSNTKFQDWLDLAEVLVKEEI